MPIPLFTSLPPKLSRKDGWGDDYGETYQSLCIDSWLASGFSPVSINAASEAPQLRADNRVRQHNVSRDSSALYGKPLVFLEEFLRIAADEPSRIVAITNADILLEFSTEQQDALQALPDDACVVMKRRDIRSARDRKGKVYPYGYDFFAAPAWALAGIVAPTMAFGVPWWDHFLPLHLMLRGMRSVDLGSGVYHLVHTERWDITSWSDVGETFERSLEDSLAGRKGPARTGLDVYLQVAKRARDSGEVRWTTQVERRMINRFRKRPATRDPFFLARLSHLNNALIDGWRGGNRRGRTAGSG